MTAPKPEVYEWLDACCRVLADELDRQRRVLEICQAQSVAARARDIDKVETMTRELATHIEAALRAERARLDVVDKLVNYFQLPPERQNLTTLVKCAPEPWSTRLKHVQIELRTVVAATQRVVNANARYLNEGLRATDRLLDMVFGRTGKKDGYDDGGRTADRAGVRPTMLNTAG